MPKTILFVDQEQFVHKALQRSFRKMRDQWEMRFVNDPAQAFDVLAAEPVDVLITEMVFSGQNGLNLLFEVREKYAHIVRIILSGYADRDVILKSVDLAHQYLAKPCEDSDLKATIDQAFLMKDLLDHEPLKQLVARIDSLPSLPSLYVELVDELKSENASIQRVGDIIAKDLGLTAKILKLVNSSFFGLSQRVSSPAKAVSLLGLDLVQAIVLTSGTFDKFSKLKFKGFSIEQMWEHAMDTAAISRVIAQEEQLDRKAIDTAVMAGLLHDIGKLLIAAYMPEQFAAILKHMQNQGESMASAEVAILGTTHAAIGAYLLGLWGLPDAIIDAVAFHHNLAQRPADELTPVGITHVASAFANHGSRIGDAQSIVDNVDYAYMEQNGFLERLQQWQHTCAERHEAGAA